MENYNTEIHDVAIKMNELYDFITVQENGLTNDEVNKQLGAMTDEDLERFHAYVFNNGNKRFKQGVLDTLGETNLLVKNTLILLGAEEKERKGRLVHEVADAIYNNNNAMHLIMGVNNRFPHKGELEESLSKHKESFLENLLSIVNSMKN